MTLARRGPFVEVPRGYARSLRTVSRFNPVGTRGKAWRLAVARQGFWGPLMSTISVPSLATQIGSCGATEVRLARDNVGTLKKAKI